MSQPITTSSFSGASGCHSVPLEADKFSSIDSKLPLQEVSFRILCTNDKVGAIIGKAGTIVRALQNDSGASIAVGPNVAECNERMITITALEVSWVYFVLGIFLSVICGSSDLVFFLYRI